MTALRRARNITIALVVAFCLVSFLADRAILNSTYKRYTPDKPSLLLTYDDVVADYPRVDAGFKMGSAAVAGYVYGAENDSRGLIVFRHGLFSQHQDYLALICALVDKGWKVYAYDALGCGASSGDSTIGFSQAALDVRAALAHVQDAGIAGDLPIYLLGHSWGGYGVAAALQEGTPVKAVVTMSGFYEPMAIMTQTAKQGMGAFAYTQVPFLWLNNVMDFGADANLSAVDGINAGGVPVLVVYGDGDETVPFEAQIASQFDAMQQADTAAIVENGEGRNGHNDYFYSPASQKYLNEQGEKLEELLARYEGDVPADELARFMEGVDKRKANTADPELIESIDAWFAQADEQPPDE